MGRVSKVELYGLLERVVEMHDRHKTIKEIEAALKDEGYDISRESIRRSIKTSTEAAGEYRKAYEESRAIVEAVKNNPNTDVYETITSLLAGKILDQVKGIEEINFDDPVKMTDAISRLANSQVKIARFRLEFQKGYETAKKEFMDALNAELADHPDLLNQITAVVASMEADS